MERGNSVRIFFEPESVAIIGASRTPGKLGNTILKNLISLKYKGRIFPVNPNILEIDGLKAYNKITDIPYLVDVAVIAVPSHLVLNIVRDCARKGVKGVIIISSGFSEAGREGAERQRELSAVASAAGMRIIGPNTTGILNMHNRFTSTFLEVPVVREGPIAFIAQTGMFAGMMLERILTSEKFGLSKVAGLGNKADVADHEILDYLAGDSDTKTIMMYIEGIKNGKHFFESARRLTAEKPVVVLKGGRTEAGAKAALSHTGSLAGRDDVFEALCRQANIVRARDFEELVDYAKMFAYLPLPAGNRLAIVTLSGAAGVISADFCLQNGLQLANLKASTLQSVAAYLPSWANAGNPLDIEPLTESMEDGTEAHRIALEAVLADENVDQCLLITGTLRKPVAMTDLFKYIKNKYAQKPLAVCIMGLQDIYEQSFNAIEDAQIPVFPGLSRAVNGLGALYRYTKLRENS